jgi:hypothetical protein
MSNGEVILLKLLKVLLAVLAVGVASVAVVQLIYKRFYMKWQYFTLYDEDERD